VIYFTIESNSFFVYHLDDKKNENWVLSPEINFERCPGSHVKFQLTPVDLVSFDGMGRKYCFSTRATQITKVNYFQIVLENIHLNYFSLFSRKY